MPATVLLNAFGMSLKDILKTFYQIDKVYYSSREDRFELNVKSLLVGGKVLQDVVDPKSGDVLLKANKKIRLIENLS